MNGINALAEGLGRDIAFWSGYLTNGKHLGWYGSLFYTLFAAFGGGLVALTVGVLAAAIREAAPAPFRVLVTGYIHLVRGVPDVLFFLFFPLAVEQGLEWLVAQWTCPAGTTLSSAWPPCDAANLRLDTMPALLLATLSLGLVYGAFAANVIAGALRAVPAGQVEAARAFGMSKRQVLWRIEMAQMWAYALPGLANVWMSLLKATSLLSLLQIVDFVAWAQRLGAANFTKAAGLVHEDWRWRYFLVLLAFYVVMTFLSERGLAALTRWARRGRGDLAVAP